MSEKDKAFAVVAKVRDGVRDLNLNELQAILLRAKSSGTRLDSSIDRKTWQHLDSLCDHLSHIKARLAVLMPES